MRFLLLTHAILGICGAVLLFLTIVPVDAFSFAMGAILSFFNLVGLVLIWPNILAKKLVALSVAVIVFKFAILAWIVNEVATSKLSVGWFAVGLGLIVPSVMAAAVYVSREPSTGNPSKT